jgi:uncharacterized membrane protein HdeD (DUF308 family)
MNSKITLGSVRKASGWSMLWGILMFICGILAISLPLASSIGIVIVLAWLILFAAICHLIFAFQSHGVGGFLWEVLLALVYGIAGIYMLINPLLGVLSLTLVLAVFLCSKESWRSFFISRSAGPRTLVGFCSTALSP